MPVNIFKRFLNAFTEGAETTESGSVFQVSTTQFEKLFDRTLSLVRDLYKTYITCKNGLELPYMKVM